MLKKKKIWLKGKWKKAHNLMLKGFCRKMRRKKKKKTRDPIF